MADFFQPSNETVDKTSTATPSPAAQAAAKFKVDILGQLLGAAAQKRPSFGDFVGGAQMPANLPGGLNSGIAGLLAAMSQPGAFTATGTGLTETDPSAPSLLSDLAQLGLLAGVLHQSGAFGALGNILAGVGGALGISGVNTALGDTTPNTTFGDSSGQAQQNALDALFGNSSQGGTGATSYGVLASDAGTGDDYLDAILNFI